MYQEVRKGNDSRRGRTESQSLGDKCLILNDRPLSLSFFRFKLKNNAQQRHAILMNRRPCVMQTASYDTPLNNYSKSIIVS